MTDKELIKQVVKKRRKAQRQLFDKYFRYVYSISLRYVRDPRDAEEVTSTVFNKVFENISKFIYYDTNSLRKWIATIAINESLRPVRKEVGIFFTEDISLYDDVDDEFASECLEEFDISVITKAIDQLPEGYRTIFLLNVIEGLSHSEIASFLKISRNTSKSQMLKARKVLIKLLKDETKKIRR